MKERFASEIDTTMPGLSTQVGSQKPPDREERARCWAARDAYFNCLDEISIVAPGEEEKLPKVSQTLRGEQASSHSWSSWLPGGKDKAEVTKDLAPCAARLMTYSKECPKSWFDYFNKLRILKERQRLTMEEMEKNNKDQGSAVKAGLERRA